MWVKGGGGKKTAGWAKITGHFRIFFCGVQITEYSGRYQYKVRQKKVFRRKLKEGKAITKRNQDSRSL